MIKPITKFIQLVEAVEDGKTSEVKGREINGVFVPAEIEDWINTMIGPNMPLYTGRGHFTKFERNRIAQDFNPAQLHKLINNIYPAWKDKTSEEIKFACRKERHTVGSIRNSLAKAKWYSDLSPVDKQTFITTTNAARKTRTKNFYSVPFANLAENVKRRYIRNIITSAIHRTKIKPAPFFYDVFKRYTAEEEKKLKDQVVDYVYSIWPKNNKCPVTGIELKPIPKEEENETNWKNRPSIDKFIPEKGYVKGNIAVISFYANMIKNSGTLKQIGEVTEYAKKGPAVLKEIKNKQNGFIGSINEPRRKKTGYKLNTFISNISQRDPNHELSTDYLREIFPIDMKCPVFGTTMTWNDELTDNNPSIDKIIPSKGYTKGNVCFVSYLANRIKQDASYQILQNLHNWMKSHNAVPDPQIREELKKTRARNGTDGEN